MNRLVICNRNAPKPIGRGFASPRTLLGRYFVSISLLICPSSTVAAVLAQVDVTTQRISSTVAAPLDLTDPSSGSRGTLQFSPTATCYGLACQSGGPAVGAYITSGITAVPVQVSLLYDFSIAGPSPTLVPLLVSGFYSNSARPVVDYGSIESSASVGFRQIIGALASFTSRCSDYPVGFNETPQDVNCGTGAFNFNYLASSSSSVQVSLTAGFRLFGGPDGTPSPAYAFIDPDIQIDPVWLSTHAGYSLVFDPNVANAGPSSATPEPGTLMLMFAGIVSLAGCQFVPRAQNTARTARGV